MGSARVCSTFRSFEGNSRKTIRSRSFVAFLLPPFSPACLPGVGVLRALV